MILSADSSGINIKNESNPSRSTLLSAFLIFGLMILPPGSGLTINSHGGYEDLVVAVGNDVPPITCQQLVKNLQGIFESASESLHVATKGKSYFHRVLIVLPPMWDQRACGSQIIPAPRGFTSAASIAAAEFRIGGEHPVFDHKPWTQQSQGCGKPGDFISLGYKYILQYNESENGRSQPDRDFVHEWAKFRYGVFEETGFRNDPIYPPSYIESGEVRKPNSCTNGPLNGNWSGGCDLKGKDCIFVPSHKDNDNITSSIMSHPHLANMRSFCDGSNHQSESPTKQNFLCDRRSVGDVVFSHPDFRNMTHSPRGRIDFKPEFVIKQLTQPRFVLMIEETGNMNLRDVWKYLKLAIRKFIKYDLPTGTQIGLMTVNSDIRVLANMTSLEDSERGRGTLAEKLPNYPSIEPMSGGSLSLLKGITQAINMLKMNGQRVAGSVILLVSQGISKSPEDLESALRLLHQEEVAIATIEYPSVADGKISYLSQGTGSPHFAIRESGVGTMSHMSTYIQLINALTDIQRFFTKNVAAKWPVLIHQDEFKGDAPSFVESSFSFDASQAPAQFYIYIPNPIDPKVNKVELTSPTGAKFTDQQSYLHDINVIKIDAVIDQPGVWRYRIERLGDSHQSHFVQVVSQGGKEDFSVRIFSNAHASRHVNLTTGPFILYAEVVKGNSPVIHANVEAFIRGPIKWSVRLYDNGNGDPDLTKNDGVYSRYIIPPASLQGSTLDILVKVTTSPYHSRFLVGPQDSHLSRHEIQPCCGSFMVHPESPSMKTMPYNERIASYRVKMSGSQKSSFYPPARIGDLKIVDQLGGTVYLEFTTPGEDYDQGLLPVRKYRVYFKPKTGKEFAFKSEINTFGIEAGRTMNISSTFTSYGLYSVYLVGVDSFNNSGSPSNIIQVLYPDPNENLSGSTESQITDDDGKKSEKLTSGEIAAIVIGVIVFFIVIILIIMVFLCCRRRASKGMGSTDTKISTISDTKAPIHWTASELLQEHEKRQSIYGQSQSNFPYPYEKQRSEGKDGGFNDVSPGSSTRSFRSISDNANHRKTSEGGSSLGVGRRLTDYESCSSEPTMKSLKGQTDYDTAVDSDPENYRNFEQGYNNGQNHHGIPAPPFRTNHYIPNQMHQHQQMQFQRVSVNNQYNPNIQGSLTSVNSKRRNITMV